MPYVSVRLVGKLTRDQKSQIAKEFSKTLEKVASKPPSSTYIVFDEVDKENWAKGTELIG